MCGINGVINPSLGRESIREKVKVMNDTTRHRGPDGMGVYAQNGVGLGHVRLSIIDLSENGKQPMMSIDGRFIISFNGEIYNYKELKKDLEFSGREMRTESDTEVILELFSRDGIDAVHKIRGMFSFALLDRYRNEILLFRDRLGIKPLYYLVGNNNEFLFSSEIKGVASVMETLTFNSGAFTKFLRSCLFTDDETVFSEVKKLNPGCYLKYDLNLGEYSLHQYYSLQSVYEEPIYQGSDAELVGKLIEKLNETIDYHMVSDVPVGSFLSGGLDSSVVTAVMSRIESQKINTNSVVYRQNYNGANEDVYSNYVADQLGTNHHKLILDEKLLSNMQEIAWFADEPLGIMSPYALFELSRLASKENKVVLTGDGADELLGGYNGLYQPLEHKFQKASNIFRMGYQLLAPATPLLNFQQKYYYTRLLDYSQNAAYNFSNQATYNSTRFLTVLDNDLFLEGLRKWESNNKREYFESIGSQSEIRKKTYALLKTRLVDEMLTKVDRMTMAHSLEARVPFLDHEFAEFCIRLPDRLKYNPEAKLDQRNKYVLREAGRQILPKKITDRRKQGFNVPIGDWIKKDQKRILELVVNGELIKHNIISKKSLEQYMSHFDSVDLLFVIANFELWYKAYTKRLPSLKINFR